jgi:hypothetical protein
MTLKTPYDNKVESPYPTQAGAVRLTEEHSQRITPKTPSLPEYLCHKKVWALKIEEIRQPVEIAESEVEIVFADKRYPSIFWDRKFPNTATPEAGWYYVVYTDGFRSFSPTEAFESGYSLIDDPEDMASVSARMVSGILGTEAPAPTKTSISHVKSCYGATATAEEIAADATPSHVPPVVVKEQEPEQKAQQAKIAGYRTLSVEEIELMNEIKSRGLDLEHLVNKLRNHQDTDKRWVSIGATDLQTGLMALTRSVARPTTFA